VATPSYILDIRRSYGHGRLLLPGVSGVVVRNDIEPGRSHILLLRRADTGRWSVPAGIVEPDEQPATTIVRELFEETRVHARADRLALLTTDPELTYPNGDRCQYISMTFRCTYLGGEAEVGDEESTEVAWFGTDQLPPGLPDLLRRRIATALADREACAFDF
jgi:8-oxo-dGTP diphosphatase